MTHRIKKINAVVRGWINYFALGDMKSAIRRIDEHLRVQMIVIIWKQWKVRKKREWELKKLGVSLNMAHRVSGMGDRYIAVANNRTIKWAITKEKLTKRGLVSPLDYYLKQHTLKLN